MSFSPRPILWLGGQERLRRTIVQSITSTMLVLLLSLSLSTNISLAAAGKFPLSQGASSGAPISPVASGTSQNTSVDYCGLLGPNPVDATLLPNYTKNVTALWSTLCALQPFIRLINEWGNLYLAYTGGANNVSYWASGNLSIGTIFNGTQAPEVQPGVHYSTLCTNVTGGAGFDCFYEEYWNGNVTTNTLTGPFTMELACPGCVFGVPPHPTAAGSTTAFPTEWILGIAIASAMGVGIVLAARRSPPPSAAKLQASMGPELSQRSPATPGNGNAPAPPRPDRPGELPGREGLDDML